MAISWKYEKLSAPENKEYLRIKKKERVSCVQRADFLGYSSTCDLENFVKTAKRKRLGEIMKNEIKTVSTIEGRMKTSLFDSLVISDVISKSQNLSFWPNQLIHLRLFMLWNLINFAMLKEIDKTDVISLIASFVLTLLFRKWKY